MSFMTRVRTTSEEVDYRCKQRVSYFEEPNYRKWSDFLSPNYRSYGNRTDDFMIASYILGRDAGRFSINDVKLFDKTENPRVNWNTLYRYVDARLNDEKNGLRGELTRLSHFIDYDVFGHLSIVDLLNQYRDRLYKPDYDII